MTYAEIATRARALSRTSTSGLSDAAMWPVISMIYRQFAIDVHGLPSQDYIEVAAKFFPRTHFGFHLEIVGSSNNDIDSDIAVTDADADDYTGDEMATELQAQIRTAIGVSSDLTVAWSDFAFVVDAIDSTSIAITAVEDETEDVYVNYVDELFGGEISGTTSCTGTLPEGCTSEQDLPSDAVTVNKVMWDKREVFPAVDTSLYAGQEGSGDPVYYKIRGKKLYLAPYPAEKKQLWIDYKRLPEIPAAPDGDTSLTEIPIGFHRAIVYGVAATLLEDMFEDYLAKNRRQEYERGVRKYLQDYYNANTNTKRTTSKTLWYGVVSE